VGSGLAVTAQDGILEGTFCSNTANTAKTLRTYSDTTADRHSPQGLCSHSAWSGLAVTAQDGILGAGFYLGTNTENTMHKLRYYCRYAHTTGIVLLFLIAATMCGGALLLLRRTASWREALYLGTNTANTANTAKTLRANSDTTADWPPPRGLYSCSSLQPQCGEGPCCYYAGRHPGEEHSIKVQRLQTL
jgi:hypothetical protein